MFRSIRITRLLFVVFCLVVAGCTCPPTVAAWSALFVVRDKVTGEFINDAVPSATGPLGVQDTGYPPNSHGPVVIGRMGQYGFYNGIYRGMYQVTFTHPRYRTYEATFAIGVVDDGTCLGTFPTYNIQLNPL